MSAFFPVELLGAGTSDVECLPSYLLRFSRAHGVSIPRLFDVLHAWANRNTLIQPSCKWGFRNLTHMSFVRPNAATELLVRILSVGTKMDELRSATFLAFGVERRKYHYFISRYFRWCPLCVLERRKNNEPEFIKILWLLVDLSYCHLHNLKLKAACIHCKNLQHALVADKSGRFVCCSCKKDLIAFPEESDYVPTHCRTGGDLVQFIQFISENPLVRFPSRGPLLIIQKLEHEASFNQKSKALLAALQLVYRHALRDPDIHFTVKELRTFALICGVAIHDVLAGNLSNITSPLDFEWDNSLHSYAAPIHIKRRDVEIIKKRLLLHLNKVRGTYPSLRSVARAVEVTVGYLRYRFPIIAKRIAREYMCMREKKAFTNRCHARAAAIAYFTNKGIDPAMKSRKKALKIVRENTQLAKHLVRNEVNDIYQRLHSGRV